MNSEFHGSLSPAHTSRRSTFYNYISSLLFPVPPPFCKTVSGPPRTCSAPAARASSRNALPAAGDTLPACASAFHVRVSRRRRRRAHTQYALFPPNPYRGYGDARAVVVIDLCTSPPPLRFSPPRGRRQRPAAARPHCRRLTLLQSRYARRTRALWTVVGRTDGRESAVCGAPVRRVSPTTFRCGKPAAGLL